MTRQRLDKSRRLFALTTALFLAMTSVAVGQLSVVDYIELSIARLELARTNWNEEGRGLTEAEEAALFDSFGTTAETYYDYAGEMAEEIAAYLDDNPKLADLIESLSAEIRSLIESTEDQ